MNIALVLSLLLPLCQQEPEQLIRQLDSDSLEERERAAEKLLAMGESAREALQKAAAGQSPESRSRAGALLRKLDRIREFSAWYSPAAKISIRGVMTLEQAVKEIQRQSGRHIGCESWPSGEFQVHVHGLSLWDALESVCKSSGKRTIALTSSMPTLIGSSYREVPSFVEGDVCVRANAAGYDREYTFGNATEEHSLTIILSLAWGKSVEPVVTALRLRRAVDEQGNDITKGFKDHEERRLAGSVSFGEDPLPTSVRSHQLTSRRLADSKPSAISLDGEITIWACASSGDIVLTLPDAGGEVHDSLDVYDTHLEKDRVIPISLSQVMQVKDCLRCTLTLDGLDSAFLKDSSSLWYLKDKHGTRYGGDWLLHRQGGRTSIKLAFRGLPENTQPDSVTIRLPRRVVERTFTFTLKNICLTSKDR